MPGALGYANVTEPLYRCRLLLLRARRIYERAATTRSRALRAMSCSWPSVVGSSSCSRHQACRSTSSTFPPRSGRLRQIRARWATMAASLF